MWHGRHEDGIGRTVSFHELESCRWLQLQNCIRENTVNHSVLATKEIAVRNSLAPWKQNAGLYWPAFPPAHQYKRGQPRSWQWILIYNALVELKSSTIFIYQRLRYRVIKFTASNHRFWVEGRAGGPQSNPLLATRAGCSRPCKSSFENLQGGRFPLLQRQTVVKLMASLWHSWSWGIMQNPPPEQPIQKWCC